jgi:hypothetical protein
MQLVVATPGRLAARASRRSPPRVRSLAKFAGCVALTWVNPLLSHHKMPGDNTVVSWPHFRPAFEVPRGPQT